jgi:hypothetical protein
MKSVGDFAINIIPTIDTKRLREDAALLGNIGNITQITDKLTSGFKAAYSMIDDTANSISNLAYTARALKMPIEQIDLLRKSLRLVGVDANDAQQIFAGLTKTAFGFKWGKVGEGLLAQGGMTPAMFGKDRLKNIEMLHRVLKGAEYGKASTVVGELGLPESSLRLLQSPNFYKILEQAKSGGLISGRQGKAAMDFIGQKGGFANVGETFKANVMENVLPAFTQALNEFTNIISGSDFVKNMSLLAESMAMFTVGITKVMGGTVGVLGGAGELIGKGIDYFTKENVVSTVKQQTEKGYVGSKENPVNAANADMLNKTPVINITNISDGTHVKTTIDKAFKEKNKQSQQVTNARGKI